ncbi:lipopolysaccharide heptosyltransferase I [Desulforhabdus amnigena]|uniref:Lipopolysaccharide heptosyltransferase 1 n=1 Tax=Desulforhabdus amnigena TaxID=40218 RepID=A0A9W6D1Q6_9BACT|nr:lipopolysaccharide heptosyltransferase I [Desulforhabdus amnigena]GLI32637.1 lipopolysaccharide heptosyltransferase I [Desulforhabdus amnigena]
MPQQRSSDWAGETRSLHLDVSPAKILIVKPSALGDIVHSLPFLNAVRERFPKAEIHWVVARGLHGILEDHPMIHRLWIIDKDQWKRLSRIGETFSQLRHLFSAIRRERFDMVVDLQGLFRSGIISYATGAKRRIGFKEAREGSPLFYTHRICGGRDIHAVERYMKIAAFLGCNTARLRFPLPPFPTRIPLMDSLPEDYIVLAPSAGTRVKRWPPERFGELAARLPFTSVIVAGKADVPLAERVLAASAGKAISLAGKTSMKELLAVIQKAKFVVSNDTGPMHIAAALEVPVFAIFGPTNPLRTGPYGAIHTIIREDLSCSPCYRRKECADVQCMKNLTLERVLGIIDERSNSKDFFRQ